MIVKPDTECKTQLKEELHGAEVVDFFFKLLAKVPTD